MKKLINALIIILLTTTYSCKKDDDIIITLDSLEVTIDENPTDGQVIGTVQGNGSNTFTFSIDSQTPNGALNINANTGELTVADPMLFDFETNPVITAVVSANEAQNTATVTINLNDVDEIVAQDVNITIDENPNGDQLIGALQATAGSNLTYTITFQNPAGAFVIDQNTGQLYVDDSTLFDYETNPNMLATISISNGIETVSKNAFITLNDVYEIGEFKHGGVIFWIDATGYGGLVSAIEDQGVNVTWGCQGTSIGGTSTSIGTGEANTNTIATNCAASDIAAKVASNASINGYDDWFLPSKSELQQLYNQRNAINNYATANGGTTFVANSSTRYWSSSESNGNTAWCKHFSNGNDIGLNKDAAAFFRVRVIRAWSDL